MAQIQNAKSSRGPGGNAVGRLFLLDASGGRVLSVNPDGSDRNVIVTGCRSLMGLAWILRPDTSTGPTWAFPLRMTAPSNAPISTVRIARQLFPKAARSRRSSSISIRRTAKLYWCDREGMRVMRVNLDGSNIETLVDTSQGDSRPGPDATKWCVGIAVDNNRGQIYWTQKGPDDAEEGRIFRANREIPEGQNAANRTDIELLFDGLARADRSGARSEQSAHVLDRPRRSAAGNTVNRAPIDADFKQHPDPKILVTHLMEGIGMALDFKGGRMFLTDLAGDLYSAKLDGSQKKLLLGAQGNLTGIAYAEIPVKEI